MLRVSRPAAPRGRRATTAAHTTVAELVATQRRLMYRGFTRRTQSLPAVAYEGSARAVRYAMARHRRHQRARQWMAHRTASESDAPWAELICQAVDRVASSALLS